MTPPEVSRRSFLGSAAVGGAAFGAVTLVGGSAAEADRPAAPAAPGPAWRAFRGFHQAGVLEAPAPHGLLVAFGTVDPDRRALAGTLRALSGELESLVNRSRPQSLDRALPPADNGVLDGVADNGMSATLSVGASLFDGRYGLARSRPRELVTMPFFRNDKLDPERSHGDLLLILQGGEPDVCLHALRRVMRATRSGLVAHWMLPVFTRPDATPTPGQTQSRNLLGFKDGTANPDPRIGSLMDDLVWTGAADGEPAWTAGGTYQVVRAIRMFVEQWDRASLGEQEEIIGRHKRSGAPLGERAETDTPVYDDDPRGERIPLDAHIRLANPRTPETAGRKILRRGMSYSRGVDGAGLLDQGLAFVSYQRRLAHFAEIQNRLDGEPLEEYLQTDGGGYFYVLPGVRDDGDWLGRALLES